MMSHVPALITLAYIDPASGSLLFQLLIAGVLSVTVAVRSVRDRISGAVRGLFRRERRDGRPAGPSASPPAAPDPGRADGDLP